MDDAKKGCGRWCRFAPGLLFVLVVAFYLPSVNSGFVYDDHVHILSYSAPRSAAQLARVCVQRLFGRDPNELQLPYYRPLSRSTYVVQRFLHGDNAGPFHFFNAVLMGVATLVALVLLRTPVFAMRPAPALMGAAMFALHPLASACTHPIINRETLIAAIFVMGALAAFLRAGGRSYLLAAVMFGAALLSKEQAIVMPAVFLLADLLGISAAAPGRRLRRWIGRYAPFAVICIAYMLIRARLYGGGQHALALFDRPTGPLLTLLYCLQTIFAPFVEMVYEPPVIVWWSTPRLLVSFFAVTVLALIVRRHWPQTRRPVLFWLGWIVLTLLPMANILTQEARFAERYTLLALLGIVAIAIIAVSTLWDHRPARVSICILGPLLLAACAVISFNRGHYYRNDVIFFRQWVHTNPQSAHAWDGLGITYGRRGQFDQAIVHFEKAIELQPDYHRPHANLGLALTELRRYEQAHAALQKALSLKPGMARVHSNLGKLLFMQGKYDQAAAQLRKAVQLRPDSADFRYKLGQALLRLGELEEAIRQLRLAVELDPGFAPARETLDQVLAALESPR